MLVFNFLEGGVTKFECRDGKPIYSVDITGTDTYFKFGDSPKWFKFKDNRDDVVLVRLTEWFSRDQIERDLDNLIKTFKAELFDE